MPEGVAFCPKCGARVEVVEAVEVADAKPDEGAVESPNPEPSDDVSSVTAKPRGKAAVTVIHFIGLLMMLVGFVMPLYEYTWMVYVDGDGLFGTNFGGSDPMSGNEVRNGLEFASSQDLVWVLRLYYVCNNSACNTLHHSQCVVPQKVTRWSDENPQCCVRSPCVCRSFYAGKYHRKYLCYKVANLSWHMELDGL